MNANTNSQNQSETQNQIAELNAKIYMLCHQNKRQQEYINSLARKIGRIHQTIYQICGKVFDHDSEMDYVFNYMNYMSYNNHTSDGLIQREFDDSDEDEDDDEDNSSECEDKEEDNSSECEDKEEDNSSECEDQ